MPLGSGRAYTRFPALQSCSHGEHIKCSPARAELAMNLTYLRPDRRPVVGAWLVLGVSPNIYKLKATLCGLLCLRKLRPGILVWNGMQFPLGTRLGKCVPLFSWIPGCIPFRALIVGCSFRLRSLHSTENPGSQLFGYPGFSLSICSTGY